MNRLHVALCSSIISCLPYSVGRIMFIYLQFWSCSGNDWGCEAHLYFELERSADPACVISICGLYQEPFCEVSYQRHPHHAKTNSENGGRLGVIELRKGCLSLLKQNPNKSWGRFSCRHHWVCVYFTNWNHIMSWKCVAPALQHQCNCK